MPAERSYNETRNKIIANLIRRRNARDQQLHFFGHSPQGTDRTLVDYINECEKRFHGYKVKPDWKEDWQANYIDPMTHDKAMAVIARVASQPYRAELQPRGDLNLEAERRAGIVENVNDYNEDILNDRSKDNFLRLFEACIKGTVIVFEDYESKKIDMAEFQKLDTLTGKVEWIKKTIIEGGLTSRIAPLEEFYPENIWDFEMKNQTGASWVQVMKRDEFRWKFRKWEGVESALDRSSNIQTEIPVEFQTFFRELTEIQGDKICVVRDFDCVNNTYHILAGGVLLTKEGNPMRWKPGRLPFAKGVFELFSPFFFYGKSIVHKLENNQDAVDALFNMFLDRTMISLFRPLITSLANDIAGDPIAPNSVIAVADAEGTREVGITEPGNAALRAIQNMKSSADLSSVDPNTQGVSVNTRTATEVAAAQEGAREILAIFRDLMNWMEKERAELRIYNIGQYYTRPSEIEKAVGEGGAERWKLAFNKFIIKDTLLPNGKRGKRSIQIVPTIKNLLSKEEVKRQNLFIRGESEVIQVTPDYFRNMDIDIRIMVAPAITVSDAMQRELTKTFSTIAFQRPDIFNLQVVAKRLAEAFYQSDDVINSREQSQNMPMGGEGVPGGEVMRMLSQGQNPMSVVPKSARM